MQLARYFCIFFSLFCITLLYPLIGQGALTDPKLKWFTIQTPHFNIHYYKGEEVVAERISKIAEATYDTLTPRFKWTPWGRTEVVIIDTTDQSNGTATIVPYNHITLFISTPEGGSSLNNYQNWLEDLFLHEYVHILQNDMYSGIVTPFRYVLGRIAAPNMYAPAWIHEGIAVQEESLSGKGRANSSLSEMILRTDILNDEFLSLDQMAGLGFEYPSGQAPYIYGGMFWTYLTEKYGGDKAAQFSKNYGKSPWLFSLNNKAKKTFDKKSFYKLHREWKEFLTKKYTQQADLLKQEGLSLLEDVVSTREILDAPTVSPDGTHLLYTEYTAFKKEALYLKNLVTGKTERLAKGKLGTQYSFSPDGGKITYAKIDQYKNYYHYYDLYEIDLKTKKSKKITRGLRALDPDYSPDGKGIVFVSKKLTRTQLNLWDIEKKEAKPLTNDEEDVQFSNPRFSPDGKLIAVSVWRGGQRDIYLYDLEGKVQLKVTDDAAIDLHPVFSPDGKSLFYSSDASGINNIYRYDLEEKRSEKISNVLTGVFKPQVFDDKVYVQNYFGKGYDIKSFQISAKTTSHDDNQPRNHEQEFAPTSEDNTASAPPITEAKKYNPFKKLFVPRLILPGIAYSDTLFLFATTGSTDPLLRHRWIGSATYRTDANFLGGDFTYSYHRFFPTIYASFNDFAVEYGQVSPSQGSFFQERRRGSLGTFLGRDGHQGSAYYFYEDRSAAKSIPADATALPTMGQFAGLGFGYNYSRATKYPGSISLEDGPRVELKLEITDSLLGSSNHTEQIIFSGGIREYIPLPLENHVIALRAAGGITWGDRLSQGTFRLGSAIGEDQVSLGGYDDLATTTTYSRLFPLRGLPDITFAGEKALLFSGEYRLPLIYPQRGLGTTPIHLNKLYAAFFADYGTVSNSQIKFENFLLGVGAELRGDFELGYGFLPVTARLGYGIIIKGREFIRGLTDPVTGADIRNGTLILSLGTSF